jgi:UDP-N-acetylmuramoyl-L-alanyl-D-glutamate--2,6-diaminopimelate ligase
LKISELVAGIARIPESQDRIISGLCNDSREVAPGNCFFALKGQNFDGRDFIPIAVEKGAVAIIMDEATPYPRNKISVPLFFIANLNEKLGDIAARFYHYPSKKLTTIGITGTNGKTSISQYIAIAMNQAAYKCGVIGSLGYGFPGNLLSSTHTTSDALIVQKQLAEICQQGAKAIAMEVSSHALDQHRVRGIKFDTAIFTNLTQDHLDYHGTMENYAAAKKKLFYVPNLNNAIINIDDPYGKSLVKELEGKINIYCYTLQSQAPVSFPTLQASQICLNGKGVTAKVVTPWGEGQLRSKLMGRFNVSNSLAVLAAIALMGIPLHTSLELIANLTTVPGRMQVFGGGKLPLVVVDFSHTPDALMQALVALREHTHGTLWCLFGCGGDRDRGKRPLMAQIAERYSDQLVITDDNPRTEDPVKIVNEMVSGLLCPWAVEIEHNRGAAIAHVISCAQPGDVVLVAGKGHENYQIIGTEKIPFSDSEQVQAQLKLRPKNTN